MVRRNFYDPTGEIHGIPTWPWGMAPAGLATRSQLRSRGLRPGGREPVGQIMWRSRFSGSKHGYCIAYLYRENQALPVRPMTPAMWRAVNAALLARHICTECGRLWEFCLPLSNGRCCPKGCETNTAKEPVVAT